MNGVTRIWVLAGGLATVAVLAGGWFLGVQPQLAAASTTADSTAQVDAQNQASEIKIAELSKAAAKIDVLKTENAALLKSVPTILKPNTFIRRINEVAVLDDVTVSSVAISDSAAYTAPAPSAPGALAVGTTDPAVTGANFTSVPASVQVVGTPAAVLQFAHDIQNDERVFAISGVQTTTDDAAATSGTVTGTLSGTIYTLKR